LHATKDKQQTDVESNAETYDIRWILADGSSGLLLFVTPQSWEDGVGVQKSYLIRFDIKARDLP